MKSIVKALPLLGMLLAAAPAPASDRDFQLDMTPVFKGYSPGRYSHANPLTVTVENKGVDTHGTVTISSTSFRTSYPIDLPKASKKSFTAYPPVALSDPLEFTLDTPEGSIKRTYNGTAFDTSSCFVAGISDNDDLFAAIRKRQTSGYYGYMQKEIRDVYAAAGTLPERSEGLAGFHAIGLGDGAERLTDAEVTALQDYVLTGGTLVVFGGASTPVLNDPRWADLLPIVNGKSVDLPSITFSLQNGSATMPGPVTVTKGQLAPDAVSIAGAETPWVAKRGFGAGRVIFFAFNPTEGAARKWSRLGDVFLHFLPLDSSMPIASFRAGGGWTDVTGLGSRYSYYYSSGSTGSTTTTTTAGTTTTTTTGGGFSYPSQDDMSASPFNVHMPPTQSIVIVLVSYFILVVPVNLLILRKMGRGELAWVTSPIISLAFAAIFFRYAGNLYSAKMAHSTSALVVTDWRSDRALVFGKSQLFFPRAGTYDLKLSGIQYVPPDTIDQMTQRGPGIMEHLDPIDVGEIQMPQVQSNNLGFYQFNFVQEAKVTPPISAELYKGSDGLISGRVTNTGNSTLRSVSVWVGLRPYSIPGNLEPGQTAQLKVSGQKMDVGPDMEMDYSYPGEESIGMPLQMLSQGNRALVMALIDKHPYGATIGEDDSSAPLQLVEFLKPPKGAK